MAPLDLPSASGNNRHEKQGPHSRCIFPEIRDSRRRLKYAVHTVPLRRLFQVEGCSLLRRPRPILSGRRGDKWHAWFLTDPLVPVPLHSEYTGTAQGSPYSPSPPFRIVCAFFLQCSLRLTFAIRQPNYCRNFQNTYRIRVREERDRESTCVQTSPPLPPSEIGHEYFAPTKFSFTLEKPNKPFHTKFK